MSAGVKPEDRAVQKDVLAPGQLGVEPGAQLQQRRHAAAHADPARGRAQHAGDHLQQRALARAVVADDAEHLAAPHVEGHAAQRPELVVGDRPFIQRIA